MAQQQKREFRKPREEVRDEFDKKMLDVRRVTKVVKGGRNMRFSALVVVGDKKGKVGMGILYIFTVGLFGFGWLIDTIVLLFKPNPYYV